CTRPRAVSLQKSRFRLLTCSKNWVSQPKKALTAIHNLFSADLLIWNRVRQLAAIHSYVVTIQVLDSSPPAAARVFLCCGHGSLRLPCPQHKTPCEPPKVARSPEQLRVGLGWVGNVSILITIT